MRSGRGADARGDHPHQQHELEVFATGTTVAVFPRSDEQTTHIRIDALRAGFERVREYHARPGHRPGGLPIPTASARQGGDADIVRPVLVSPLVACELAVSGELFAELVPHLRIDHHPGDPGEARSLTWDAVLTADGHRPLRASLHLLGSPSLLVTIIELIPRQRIRRRTDEFIDEGVLAVDVLADRLEHAA